MSSSAAPSGGRLSGDDRRTIALLGVPTLGLALCTTVVTTYLPVIASDLGGSTAIIGVIIGAEGLVALWLPLVAGAWSDRLRTRIGGRLPFLLAASPIVLAGLAGMAFVHSLAGLALAAVVFFTGYFIAYEPYRALYPDAVGDDAAGRAQGTQALWRGAGTGLALLGGGLLLTISQPAPFAAAGGIFVLTIGAFSYALVRRGIPDAGRSESADVRGRLHHVLTLVADHPRLRAFLIANALWELSLAALKTFVVLYVTEGLGLSRTASALIIGGAAVVVLGGAAAGGQLADRFGARRVMQAALIAYGGGLLVPFLVATPVLVAAAAPLVAFGGGIVMALPFALLMPLMPDGEHGALTGYYSVSRGVGTCLGPLLAGLAISALAGVFDATEGYQATWGVCAAAVLLSIPVLRRV